MDRGRSAGGRGRDVRASSRATHDKVLHARIPEHLDAALRSQAVRLGLSVSTLVRNVLMHTFDLVEGVVSDTAELARVLQPPAARSAATPAAAPAAAAPVIGWQEATLDVNAVCDTCNAILPRGTRASIGVPAGAHPAIRCADCLAQLASPDESEQGGAAETTPPARAAPRWRR